MRLTDVLTDRAALTGAIQRRFSGRTRARDAATRHFHRVYYYSPERTFQNTYWLGTAVLKCPLDLWIYQELITELRPDVIVETGTRHGGSALYLATICDLLGKGRVVSVDIDEDDGRPSHARITYLLGSSTADDVVARVKHQLNGAETVVVLLDSDHSRDHVLEELRIYADVVTPGSYCVVEDTNLNGNPVFPEHGPGPMEAVEAFLRERSDYHIDIERQKFFLTFNPHGFLRRAS
jgi:cephalosporin hydroxylase